MKKALVSQLSNQSVHCAFDVYHVVKKWGEFSLPMVNRPQAVDLHQLFNLTFLMTNQNYKES